MIVSTEFVFLFPTLLVLLCSTSGAFRFPVGFVRHVHYHDGYSRTSGALLVNSRKFRLRALGVREKRADASSEAKGLSKNQERLIAKWEQSFSLLEEYIRTHNGELPQRRGEGQALYSWLYTQRLRCRTKDRATGYNPLVLTEDRVQRILETIAGSSPPSIVAWEQRYNELKDFLETHDGRIPTTKENYVLRDWIFRYSSEPQSSVERNNRDITSGVGNDFEVPASAQRRDRVAKLLESAAKNGELHWERNFEQLEDYVRKHGHLPVQIQEPTLQSWLHRQRQCMDEAQETGLTRSQILRDEKINRLSALIEGVPSHAGALWEKRFSELKQFVHTHGRLPKNGEGSVRNWFKQQLSAIRADSQEVSVHPRSVLTEERTERFRKLLEGFKTVKRASWDQRCGELEEFVRAHNGRLPRQKENGTLYGWWYRQSRRWRSGLSSTGSTGESSGLTEEQTQRLSAIADTVEEAASRIE